MAGSNEEENRVGRRRPPVTTRFMKGESGNPRGRPRGRRNEPPYEAVLGQIVTIREDGIERRVTAAEAFLLHVTKRGLEGDGPGRAGSDGRDRGGAGAEPPARRGRSSISSGRSMQSCQPRDRCARAAPHREDARPHIARPRECCWSRGSSKRPSPSLEIGDSRSLTRRWSSAPPERRARSGGPSGGRSSGSSGRLSADRHCVRHRCERLPHSR